MSLYFIEDSSGEEQQGILKVKREGQRHPSNWRRNSVWREVMPSAKLTSAANSSVHTLVSLPKSLGLRCNMAFNFSRPSSLNIGRVVFGRREPISKAATPRLLKATMALRTVCSSQPRNPSIRGAISPRALDKMIWLRLTLNGLEDRNPLVRICRSSSLNSRTKIGFLILSTILLPQISLSVLRYIRSNSTTQYRKYVLK